MLNADGIVRNSKGEFTHYIVPANHPKRRSVTGCELKPRTGLWRVGGAHGFAVPWVSRNALFDFLLFQL
jgi:hypothetical protein